MSPPTLSCTWLALGVSLSSRVRMYTQHWEPLSQEHSMMRPMSAMPLTPCDYTQDITKFMCVFCMVCMVFVPCRSHPAVTRNYQHVVLPDVCVLYGFCDIPHTPCDTQGCHNVGCAWHVGWMCMIQYGMVACHVTHALCTQGWQRLLSTHNDELIHQLCFDI